MERREEMMRGGLERPGPVRSCCPTGAFALQRRRTCRALGVRVGISLSSSSSTLLRVLSDFVAFGLSPFPSSAGRCPALGSQERIRDVRSVGEFSMLIVVVNRSRRGRRHRRRYYSRSSGFRRFRLKAADFGPGIGWNPSGMKNCLGWTV